MHVIVQYYQMHSKLNCNCLDHIKIYPNTILQQTCVSNLNVGSLFTLKILTTNLKKKSKLNGKY